MSLDHVSTIIWGVCCENIAVLQLQSNLPSHSSPHKSSLIAGNWRQNSFISLTSKDTFCISPAARSCYKVEIFSESVNTWHLSHNQWELVGEVETVSGSDVVMIYSVLIRAENLFGPCFIHIWQQENRSGTLPALSHLRTGVKSQIVQYRRQAVAEMVVICSLNLENSWWIIVFP